MDSRTERLIRALELVERQGAGARTKRALLAAGHTASTVEQTLDSAGSSELLERAADLAQREIDVTTIADESYPPQLVSTAQAPAMLFSHGNLSLMTRASVGMCGSRHASDEGIEAARRCGEEVARHGLVVVSGYAKGVDTETHLGALRAGGATVIVLAEGITRFRQKRSFAETGLPPDRTLVLSQFPPTQGWTAGSAMTRNGVIAGLSKALVVIEAGETGGTLNAGMTALKMGRPVLALQFASRSTPPGNEILFEHGARPIANRGELIRELQRIEPPEASTQLRLPT